MAHDPFTSEIFRGFFEYSKTRPDPLGMAILGISPVEVCDRSWKIQYAKNPKIGRKMIIITQHAFESRS